MFERVALVASDQSHDQKAGMPWEINNAETVFHELFERDSVGDLLYHFGTCIFPEASLHVCG